MDSFSDDLTRVEKTLIVVLSLLLCGLCYYQFIYRPTTREIERLEAQSGAMAMELVQVQQRLTQLKKMREELDALGRVGYTSMMPSYNSVEEETSFLNDILASAKQYSISFSNPTRKENQVRRNVTLRFTADGYQAASNILTSLTRGGFRCLLGDLRYSTSSDGSASVSVSATFYETMAG